MFVVRPAENSDAERLCAIFFELFAKAARGRPDLFRSPAPDDAEELARLRRYVRERIELPTETLMVAEEQGVVLGFVHVLVEQVPESASVPFRRQATEGWILHIAVASEQQRRGVGRALDAAARAWARARGAQTMGLQLWTYNQEAAPFFEHLGYRARSTRLYGNC
jgi:GNAT superfamily N-acetyltransferase